MVLLQWLVRDILLLFRDWRQDSYYRRCQSVHTSIVFNLSYRIWNQFQILMLNDEVIRLHSPCSAEGGETIPQSYPFLFPLQSLCVIVLRQDCACILVEYMFVFSSILLTPWRVSFTPFVCVWMFNYPS